MDIDYRPNQVKYYLPFLFIYLLLSYDFLHYSPVGRAKGFMGGVNPTKPPSDETHITA
jgi:hypothetical protein